MKTLKDDVNISQHLNHPNKSPFIGGVNNFRPISAANVRPNKMLKSNNSKVK